MILQTVRAGKEKSRAKIVGSLKVERKSESWGKVGYETIVLMICFFFFRENCIHCSDAAACCAAGSVISSR
jgi:hypothetical protein